MRLRKIERKRLKRLVPQHLQDFENLEGVSQMNDDINFDDHEPY